MHLRVKKECIIWNGLDYANIEFMEPILWYYSVFTILNQSKIYNFLLKEFLAIYIYMQEI